MTFNPKWIKSTEVVKRDGSNSLTNDWDIGDKNKIILDELRIQDSDGLIISDTTGNILFYIDEALKTIKFYNGDSVNEISNISSTNSSLSLLTSAAIHDLNIAGTSGTSGIDGISGTSGSSGTSGIDGISGTSGSSGTSGIDGISGTSGSSGSSGSSGTSGTEKRGTISLSNGDNTAIIIFDVAESDVNYRSFIQLNNIIDVPPALYLCIITNKTINGFSVRFSGYIDSNNFTLEWFITR